jgi:hypothetical protein
MPKSAVLLPLGAMLAVALMGCGGDDAPEEGAEAEAPAETDLPDDEVDPSDEEGAPDSNCDLPGDLLERLNTDRQTVLNLALAEGANLEAVESIGLPEPDTFRSVAEVLDGLDLSGIPSNPQFDEPGDIVIDLHETADLLEAALAAGADAADPAWTELTEFYLQDFFVRHNASIGYYLNEAGCV